MLEMKKQDEER